MFKRGRAKSVDPAQALRYRTVGESLLRSASAMVELSDLDRYYGHAIAIVCIHAVIAYNDALTVAFSGVNRPRASTPERPTCCRAPSVPEPLARW